MQSALVNQGIDLMLYGMGTVFVFLVLLIIVTALMSSLVNRISPEEQPAVSPAALIPANNTQAQVEPRIVKVIEAAIRQHRGQ